MVTQGNEVLENLRQGVDLISDAVRVTLGPNGRNAILFNDSKAYITKDGVSVAKKIKSDIPSINAGVQILREASLKTAEEAGDGTTTSLVLAQRLFSLGRIALLRNMISPYSLKVSMLEAMDLVVKDLKAQTENIDINYEKIKYIATTSANNDSSVGSLVSEAFVKAGPDGIVTFDESPNGSSYIDSIEGTQVDGCIYSNDFITNKKRLETKYDNVLVLLYNGTINNFNSIVKLIQYSKDVQHPIAVIAHDFSESVIRAFLRNNYQGFTKIVPIKLVGNSQSKSASLYDVAAITNASIVEPNSPIQMFSNCKVLGNIKQIIAGYNKTVLVGADYSSDSIITRVQAFKEEIEFAEANNPEAVDFAKKRLARFLGKVSAIYVGGSTDVETKERYDRVEDAVCAVRAALEEGISAGGGSTLLKIQRNLRKLYEDKESSEGFEIVIDSLSAPFEQLCENNGLKPNDVLEGITNDIGYNFLTNSYGNLKEMGVIDPTKVLRVAIENSVSVVTLLLTTACIVDDGSTDNY